MSNPLNEDGKMLVDMMQVPFPEEGPLEARIHTTAEEAWFDDKVDISHTLYWFNEPEGGWRQGMELLDVPDPAPVTFADVSHPGDGRTHLEELREGAVLTGVVTDVWLYHGAQIDVGAEQDALLPILEDEWPAVRDQLAPGTRVRVRVHRLRSPGLHRFPLQVTAEEPDIQASIVNADEWECPLDLAWGRRQGLSIEEMAAASGRAFRPGKFYTQEDPREWNARLRAKFAEVAAGDKDADSDASMAASGGAGAPAAAELTPDQLNNILRAIGA